jgi:hypothetical protein
LYDVINDGKISPKLRCELLESPYLRNRGSRTTASKLGGSPARIRTYRCLVDLYPFMSESYTLSLLPGTSGTRRIISVVWNSLTPGEQDSLLQLLAKDKRPAVVEKTVRAMKENRPRAFSEPFVKEWLAHENSDVRVAALELLESYRSRDVVPLISPCLKDKDSTVRAAAVQVLGSLAAVDVTQEVHALLRDPSAEVREEVKKTLRAFTAVDEFRVPEGEKKK